MKKYIAYILLIFHVFITGNLSVFIGDFNIWETEKVHAVATSVSYAGNASDLWDSTMAWNTPANSIWNTTGTFASNLLVDRNVNSNTLALTNFNLSGAGLPSGAIINGIQVDVEWNADNNRVQDSLVQLTLDGSTGLGNDYATNSNWPTTKTINTYGWLTDLWGSTWTAADLLSSNFWVLLQYTNRRNPDYNVYIYRVMITVDYTVNNPPTDISLSSNSIDEGLAIGTTVWLLSTTDPDVGDTHTYSLTCTSPGADDASFALAGNNLNSAEVFNFATKSVYNICIRTTDAGWLSYDKNFVVNINEVINVAPGWVDTNLEVWLKANAGTSTTTDGNTLATWADQSGNALDATAVTAPIYRNNATDSLNFNPVIDFDGTT